MKRLLVFAALALTACQASTRVGPINSGLFPTPTPAPVVASTAPPPVAPTRLVAEVVKSDALLRDGPGEAGRVINKFAAGTTLTVRHPERGGPWYEVTYEAGGQSGWIHGSLIRFKTGTTPAYTPTPKPTPSPTATPVPSPTLDLTGAEPLEDDAGQADDIKVWVNTNSGVYHCPGTRWYGNTKEGRYETQAEAKENGYRPAYGKMCY